MKQRILRDTIFAHSPAFFLIVDGFLTSFSAQKTHGKKNMKNAFLARWSEKTRFSKYPFFGLWAVPGAPLAARGSPKEPKNLKKWLNNPFFSTFGPYKIRFLLLLVRICMEKWILRDSLFYLSKSIDSAGSATSQNVIF